MHILQQASPRYSVKKKDFGMKTYYMAFLRTYQLKTMLLEIFLLLTTDMKVTRILGELEEMNYTMRMFYTPWCVEFYLQCRLFVYFKICY